MTGPAEATLMRSLTLEALASRSARIVVATALESSSRWVELGGRRRIVTDTRVRIEEGIAKQDSSDSEVMVRTLGGVVGELGALVHGEAELALDEPCVVFLAPRAADLHSVAGMAQGHYPLRTDPKRVLRLQPSPRAAELLGNEHSAVERLVNQELKVARTRILEAVRR
ncbi:MAG TPA: hypothetical protein VER33_03150 [Polyangiaceae bacterium]|nr:hypothetical protein [Polyangiaceae bacterium]